MAVILPQPTRHESLWLTAATAARTCCSFFALVSAMEPAKKRPRLGYEQSAFVLQCTSVNPDGNLWPPLLLQLVVNGDKHEVCCNHGPPHGTWMEFPDVLTISFHYSGGANVKTSVYKPIEGTGAWLQVNGGAAWKGVLIPTTTGTL